LNRENGEWGARDPNTGSQPCSGIHPERSERFVWWRDTVTGVPSERVEILQTRVAKPRSGARGECTTRSIKFRGVTALDRKPWSRCEGAECATWDARRRYVPGKGSSSPQTNASAGGRTSSGDRKGISRASHKASGEARRPDHDTKTTVVTREDASERNRRKLAHANSDAISSSLGARTPGLK
jgi:hypothetical protein